MPSETPARLVVLVDDDPTFIETFGTLLRHEGYAVAVARSASEARDYLERHTPDVLITDIRLGSQSQTGWQLAKFARTRRPHVKVIVVTGFADNLEAEVEYWSVPVFLKPFDPHDLLDHLRGRSGP